MNPAPPGSNLPHHLPEYQFISSKNGYNKKTESFTATYQFRWKDQLYSITWANRNERISDENQYKYVNGQIDKIILLIERYLYSKEKSLKCSLDLKTVKTIEKKASSSQKEGKAKNDPFNFNVQALHLKAKIDKAPPKEIQDLLNDKWTHAKRAEELQRKAGALPNLDTEDKPQPLSPGELKIDEKNQALPFGELLIEPKTEEKLSIPYGILTPIKWLVDLIEHIVQIVSKWFS